MYHIRIDQNSKKVPLLVDTYDEHKDFVAHLNGKPIILQAIPKHFIGFSAKTDSNKNLQIFKQFNNMFKNNYCNKVYFEVDLEAGEHFITVGYTLTSRYQYSEESGILRDNFFFYNLESTRYWRSFGSLDIQIFAPKNQQLQTNLGSEYTEHIYEQVNYNQNSKHFKSGASWHFDTLPQSEFSIKFVPALNTRLNWAIFIAKYYMMLWLGSVVFFITLHIAALEKYKYALIGGGIIVPINFAFILPLSLFCLIQKIGGTENILIKSDKMLIGLTLLYILFMPFYCLLLYHIKLLLSKQKLNYGEPDYELWKGIG